MKLIIDNFGPGDEIIPISVSNNGRTNQDFFVMGSIRNGVTRAFIINKRIAQITLIFNEKIKSISTVQGTNPVTTKVINSNNYTLDSFEVAVAVF